MKRILPFLLLVFSASLAFGGHAGIWKSTQPPCNFYIQTYLGNDSILIIVTPDAVSEWYVFLDPNIYDDVNVSEMTGKQATLAFYLRGPDTALADLTVNGHSTVYNLTRVQEGDCRTIGGGGEQPPNPSPTPTEPSSNIMGTYHLVSFRVLYSDGTEFTDRDVFTFSGTMIIRASTITQSMSVEGEVLSIDGSYYITWTEGTHKGTAHVWDEYGSRDISFEISGYRLTTYSGIVHIPYSSITYQEWDTWEKISDTMAVPPADPDGKGLKAIGNLPGLLLRD